MSRSCLALVMRVMSRGVRLLAQTGLLLAWAMPVVASLTVWQWLFDSEYGVVNWTLSRLGADFEGHAWLLQPMSFYFVATVIVVWMSVPFVAFTGYAALTQVSEDLTEAAELDGAGAWQRLRHVVFPAIRPVLLIVGLLQIIWDLRVFTQIYMLQKAGGVTRDTNLLGTYIYRLGIGGGDFGTAAAVAMFMLAQAGQRHLRRTGEDEPHEGVSPKSWRRRPPPGSRAGGVADASKTPSLRARRRQATTRKDVARLDDAGIRHDLGGTP